MLVPPRFFLFASCVHQPSALSFFSTRSFDTCRRPSSPFNTMEVLSWERTHGLRLVRTRLEPSRLIKLHLIHMLMDGYFVVFTRALVTNTHMNMQQHHSRASPHSSIHFSATWLISCSSSCFSFWLRRLIRCKPRLRQAYCCPRSDLLLPQWVRCGHPGCKRLCPPLPLRACIG